MYVAVPNHKLALYFSLCRVQSSPLNKTKILNMHAHTKGHSPEDAEPFFILATSCEVTFVKKIYIYKEQLQYIYISFLAFGTQPDACRWVKHAAPPPLAAESV